MPTVEDVLRVMSTVREPELGRDLVSLDMVKDVVVDGDRVSLKVELTTPACPLQDKIQKECEAALKSLPGVRETELRFTHRVLPSKNVADPDAIPGVKNVVAVYACKGGVGKSTVACNVAASLALDGCAVGLLDADIHGPNVPLMMGVRNAEVTGEDGKLLPVEAHGLKVMSFGFLAGEDAPRIWRGPMVHGAVRQLLRDTKWGELDYLVVDLPPGTGDAQLTLVQSAFLAGVLIVTTPQDVSLLDGIKGIQMFRKMNIPILGLMENMSGFVCPHCHRETDVFSKGGGEEEARRLKIPYLGAIPLDPAVVKSGDSGTPMVIGHPQSQAAKALRWATRVMAGQISVANSGMAWTPEPAETAAS